MKKQIDSWVNNNHLLWQFWQQVVYDGTWGFQDKTEEEAKNLDNYYEGCYDMALNARELIMKEGLYK